MPRVRPACVPTARCGRRVARVESLLNLFKMSNYYDMARNTRKKLIKGRIDYVLLMHPVGKARLRAIVYVE